MVEHSLFLNICISSNKSVVSTFPKKTRTIWILWCTLYYCQCILQSYFSQLSQLEKIMYRLHYKCRNSWWVRRRQLRVQQVSWQVSADLFCQTTSLGQLRKQSPGDLLNSRSKSIAGKLPSTLFGRASFVPSLSILSPVLPVTLCCAAVHRR